MHKNTLQYYNPLIGEIFIQKECAFGQFLLEQGRLKYHAQIKGLSWNDYSIALMDRDPAWHTQEMKLLTLYQQCYPSKKISP